MTTTVLQYPDAKHIVDLVGDERTTYLNKVADFYNDLKAKGYSVPSVSLKGTGDETYLETEPVTGEYITELYKSGKIDLTKGKTLGPRVSSLLDKIKTEQDVTIFNTHTGNVVYNMEKDELVLVDLIQNTKCTEFRKVKKFSPAYLEEMRLKQEQEEKEEEEKLAQEQQTQETQEGDVV